MAEVDLTPEIRFPEFENPFQEVLLMNVLNDMVDCEHKTAPYVEDSIYKVVRTTDVKNGELLQNQLLSTTAEGFKEWTKRATPESGQILFTREAPAGESALVPSNQKICLGQRMVLLRPNENEFSGNYIAHYLQSPLAKKAINKFIIGSTVTRINMQDIAKIRVSISPIEEQQKIASFLAAVDERIQLLRNKKTKLEEYKKGLMQKLFPSKARQAPEIRFKDENGNDFPDWEDKKLNEIIIRTSTGLNPRENFKLGKGNNFYVTIKNITNGKIDFSTCELIDDEALKLIGKRCDLSKGDIIMSSIGNIGESYLLKEDPINWNINESVFMIRPNPKKVLPIFLYYILTGEYALRYFEGNMTGSSFKSIKIGDLKIMPCAVPSLKEQIRITDFLTSLDKSIESTGKEIEGTSTFKKGLLQKMFV